MAYVLEPGKPGAWDAGGLSESRIQVFNDTWLAFDTGATGRCKGGTHRRRERLHRNTVGTRHGARQHVSAARPPAQDSAREGREGL